VTPDEEDADKSASQSDKDPDPIERDTAAQADPSI